MKNENTNQIVKSVAKCLNVQLDDVHPTNQINTKGRKHATPPPPIIVRFSNRDKKNEIFRRKMLRGNLGIQSIFAVDKVTIQENLTAYRKKVYEAASMARRDLRFNYLWTS